MSRPVLACEKFKPARARYLPILNWLPRYQLECLSVDLLAGVTIAAFAIPEGMAYAGLAGLPPQAGLYASLLAVLGYSIFGTSRQLSIRPPFGKYRDVEAQWRSVSEDFPST
jgi:MFS superfamily sulfate permease-like transporter